MKTCARVHFQTSQCGIYNRHSVSGTGVSLNTWAFPLYYYPTDAPRSFFYLLPTRRNWQRR